MKGIKICSAIEFDPRISCEEGSRLSRFATGSAVGKAQLDEQQAIGSARAAALWEMKVLRAFLEGAIPRAQRSRRQHPEESP